MLNSGWAVSRLRCALVAIAATIVGCVVLVALARQRPDRVGAVDEALVTGCLLALAGCVLWAWLGVVAVVHELWTGRAPSGSPVIPQVLRSLLLVACGAALAGGVAQPGATAAVDREPERLVGLPMPERAVGGPGPRAIEQRSVVVRAGDCLWSLAAQDLAASATAAAVDARWRAIYRLNRDVIGADPDLIRPGQRLVLPPTPREAA